MTLEDIIIDAIRFDIESRIIYVSKPPENLFTKQPIKINFENGSEMLYYPCDRISQKIEEIMKEDYFGESQ